MNENTNLKKIGITGINNRYQINKLIATHKEVKKRVDSEQWTFSDEYFNYDKQLQLITDIKSNNYAFTDEVGKICMQQINKKICGYKQQDNMKKLFEEPKFITFETILDKLLVCKLKCYYCQENMSVLYDISREMKQWSVDRIDNNKGHNKDNYYLACLDCNLKRRRRSDEKFLFTKQLNILKQY